MAKQNVKGRAKPSAAPQPSAAAGFEETGLLALVLVEPLVFTPWTRNPFAVKELLVAGGLLALAVARTVAAREGGPPGRAPVGPLVALGAFVAVHLALTPRSPNPLASLAFTARLIGYGSFFLLLATRAWDARFFRRLAASTMGGTVLACLYGLLQSAGHDPVRWADTFRVAGAPLGSMRMFSTFGHPNFFGSHLAMGLYAAAAAVLHSRHSSQRAAAGGALLLGAACLLLTLNRGAWVGSAAGAAVAAVLVWSIRRRADAPPDNLLPVWRSRPAAVAAGLTAVALLAFAGSPAFRHRLDVRGGLAEPTVQSRLLIWTGAVRMARDHALAGTGPGTFGSVFPSYRDARLSDYHDELTPVTHAHNEYLELFAETGVFGLLAFGALVVAALRCGWATARLARSGLGQSVPVVLVAAAVSILAGGLFGVELRHVNASFFLWLLLGLLAAGPFPKPGDPPGETRVQGRAAIAAVALVGTLAFFAVALSQFVGETYLRRAERSLAAGQLERAAAEGKTAWRWNRIDPAGLMLAAEALVRSQDYAAARGIYRDVRRVNPGEPLIGYDLALMHYLLGDYADGLKEIEAAQRLLPRHEPTRALHYDLWLKVGLDQVKSADLEGAKAAFRAAGGILANDPRAIFLLGNVHVREGLYDAAIDRFEMALRKDPTFAPAQENLRRVRALVGR